MSDSSYIIRNYQPADFNKLVQLRIESKKFEPSRRYISIEAEEVEPRGQHISPQVIAENLRRPNYRPEQDLFLVEIAGNLVGYTDITPELTIGRVILACWIHPEHRRKGLATKLLSYATKRARELRVKVAHVNILEDNEIAKSVLSKLGFERVRRYLELRLDIAKVSKQDMEQAILGCRHLQPGEEDKLTQIQNRSFAGYWDYNPNTVETITYRLNLGNRSPEDVVLACDGDKIIGYCWTEVIDEEKTTTSERKGRIYMVGTDPDYRNRGVGRKVLLAGIAHLKNKGIQVAELTVDSENKVAYALYQSIGFKVRTSSLWYEKVID
jgi:mycothiol synthase